MLHYGARYFDYSKIQVTDEIGTSSKFSGVCRFHGSDKIQNKKKMQNPYRKLAKTNA